MCVPDSTATVKYNGSSAQPGLTAEERIRRKREEMRPNADALPAPDLADAAQAQGDAFAVRRARGASASKAFGRFGFGSFKSTAPTAASVLGGP